MCNIRCSHVPYIFTDVLRIMGNIITMALSYKKCKRMRSYVNIKITWVCFIIYFNYFTNLNTLPATRYLWQIPHSWLAYTNDTRFKPPIYLHHFLLGQRPLENLMKAMDFPQKTAHDFLCLIWENPKFSEVYPWNLLGSVGWTVLNSLSRKISLKILWLGMLQKEPSFFGNILCL